MNTIITERLEALNQGEITLAHGQHDDFEHGACAMEVVAWLAGEVHTDAPQCASPVLRQFTTNVNDAWSESQRQDLIPLLPKMVGTAGDGQDEARRYLALDWLIRVHAPAWLELAGLTQEASSLRELDRIVDQDAADRAGGAIDAAEAAARDTARDAAEAAARDTARDAAGGAARATAGVAAGVAAGGAARATARVAAWDAARAAARAAAGAAAGKALQHTMEALQDSALDLLERMIDPSAAS